jgi:hypothetical protein
VRVAARALLAFLALPLGVAAAPEMPGRAWVSAENRPDALRRHAPAATYRWDAALPKRAPGGDDRRTRVGFVLASPKAFAPPGWQAVEGGFVARFDVASPGAQGLRVHLALDGAGALEVRVRDEGGRVEAMAVAAGAPEAWGPWTAGATQAVEVFSREGLAPGALQLAGIVHFDQPLAPKAAAECTVDVACSTGNAILDAAIAQRKKSMARISFVDGGRAFVCTGTLIDTEKYPVPYFLTANHCVGRAEVAASITSFWFYEASACGSDATAADSRQVAGGMAMDFADPNTDHTLLVMNASPPSGTSFSGWNAAKLASGQAVTSLSHPAGDVAKLALGEVDGMARFDDWEQAAWLVRYSRGIIQGGSSGSGLFTMSGGTLQLRGVLSASTTDPDGALSCTNLDQRGVYNRLDVFYPQVARRLMANPPPADDHGDRPAEATPVALGAVPARATGRIDFAGDTDVFRIPVAASGTLIVRSSGGMDTVGVLLDADGERVASNDDAETRSVDFGLTQRVEPGTYYLAVTRWESAGVGPYALEISTSPVTDNYTDLWWKPDESGWGINLAHQGGVVFATLYTYGADGSPAWFSMTGNGSPGGKEFQGDLYRTTGPPFNASPWRPVDYERVGTMRLAFASNDAATLTYTVNDVPVAKSIERFRSATRTTCGWSVFDRSFSFNYQDLWWNAAESGWGINFIHQGDVLVGTLYTYGPDGQPRWFILSPGERVPGTQRFEGPLYETTGPPFNASPWGAVGYTNVGTMSVAFTDGNTGVLSYSVNSVPVTRQITRLAFGSPVPQCESDD